MELQKNLGGMVKSFRPQPVPPVQLPSDIVNSLPATHEHTLTTPNLLNIR
jgi:hypothetical protein